MMNEVLKGLEGKMVNAMDAFQAELARLRTGRASLSVLDSVHVDYYGSSTPLSQVASLSIPDPTTIMIAPWEPKVLGDVEKALLKMNLGLTPNNDGKVIRLNIPPLTEERRKELVKVAHKDAENARNNMRRIRRDGNDQVKTMEKDKEISEDQMHDGLAEIQDLTDAYIKKVNDVVTAKEESILEV
jgi:ribosome recycling factor